MKFDNILDDIITHHILYYIKEHQTLIDLERVNKRLYKLVKEKKIKMIEKFNKFHKEEIRYYDAIIGGFNYKQLENIIIKKKYIFYSLIDLERFSIVFTKSKDERIINIVNNNQQRG